MLKLIEHTTEDGHDTHLQMGVTLDIQTDGETGTTVTLVNAVLAGDCVAYCKSGRPHIETIDADVTDWVRSMDVLKDFSASNTAAVRDALREVVEHIRDAELAKERDAGCDCTTA